MDGTVTQYDAVIVGGGPAGSAAAQKLVSAGLRTLVIDAAQFPRVKLCAGWLSAPIWDALGLTPEEYGGALWRWDRCHVHYGGRRHTVAARGYFIRRVEFDDWLLRRSGAEVRQGHRVTQVARDQHGWLVDGRFRCRYLIGAGGTHCPVARALFGRKTERAVGAQELEFQDSPTAIAARRVGRDGEPELLLHDDLRGYAWNIPKTDWLNVGCGSLNAKSVRGDWDRAKDFFLSSSLPATASSPLERAKGHSYYLFHPDNLDACHRDDAFLVGDALGLAHPITAEGILPGVLSGRLCAESIIDSEPSAYRQRLASHPVFRDYEIVYRARHGAGALRAWHSGPPPPGAPSAIAASPATGLVPRAASWAVAQGFAWMFSGQHIPAGRAISGAMQAWRSLRGTTGGQRHA